MKVGISINCEQNYSVTYLSKKYKNNKLEKDFVPEIFSMVFGLAFEILLLIKPCMQELKILSHPYLLWGHYKLL